MDTYDKFGKPVSPRRMKDVKTHFGGTSRNKSVMQEVTVEKTVIQLLADIEDMDFSDDVFSVEEAKKNLNFPLDSDENINTLSQANTLIRSDINGEMNPLFVTAGRMCLNREAAMQLMDMEITELVYDQKQDPVGPPVIDQFEIRNVYRVDDRGRTPRDTQQGFDLEDQAKEASNFKFTIGANHHLIIVANANNWNDEATGKIDRKGITYTWKFTSGETNYERMDIDRIVAVGRQLSIENIKRDAIGTYICEVSNKYGKVTSFPVEIDVNHPGEVREEKMMLGENEILTGKYVWIETDQTQQYDENVTMFDTKEVYDFDVENENESYQDWPNRWVEVYYQNNRWYRDDDNTEFVGDEPFDPDKTMDSDGTDLANATPTTGGGGMSSGGGGY